MVMPHTVTLVMPNLVTPHGYVTYDYVGYAIHVVTPVTPNTFVAYG